MSRKNISSGVAWERQVGYSRAVRIDNIVSVSGTTAVDEDDNIVGPGDAYTQARFALLKIQRAIEEAGASLADIIRTRIYITDTDNWTAVARAHAEVLGEIRPASTLVEVPRLVAPELLVEIEADAVIQTPAG
jgi:enamine deaminase RidA (YjgF/YER057c/UK114 family)